MDETNKNWANQQSLSQQQASPQSSQPSTVTSRQPPAFSSQSGFVQSTPITSSTPSNFNGYSNWSIPQHFYQYSQWLNQHQQAMNSSVSPTFQTPLTPFVPKPELANLPNVSSTLNPTSLPTTPNLTTPSSVPTTPNLTNLPSMPATPNLNNFPSMSTMPTMSPFFPYQFPNLQQQQSFSPIAPMAGSPMSGSSMGGSMSGSPMVASPNVSDHGLSRNTIFVERKRPRITYTQEQIAYLETWYNNKNNFISTMERNQIARELNVSPNQIRIWFQNRRARERQRNSHRTSQQSSSEASSMNGSLDSAYNSSASMNNSSMNASSGDSAIDLKMAIPNMPVTNPQFLPPHPTTTFDQQMPPVSTFFEMLQYNQQNLLTPTGNATEAPSKPEQNFESQNGQK